MATTVQCPDGHTNQGTRTLCGVCGKQLPFPAEWRKEGPKLSPMSKGALIGGAIVLLGVGIAFAIGSNSGSSQQSTFINQPETNSPQLPASNSDDWLQAVCRAGTIVQGAPRSLPSANDGYYCVGSNNPIWIGVYDRSSERNRSHRLEPDTRGG